MKENLERPIIVSITAGTVFKAIAVVGLILLLWNIRGLVLVLLTSIVIASAINPAATYFASKRIPRIVSVLFIYLAVIFGITALSAVFLPPLIDDFQQIRVELPTYIESLTNGKIAQLPGYDAFLNSITNTGLTGEIFSKVTATFSGATVGVLATASSIFGGLFSFLLIVVISFYLAVQEDGVRDFLRVVTPAKQEAYVLDLWKRSQRKIGLWMQGQLILSVLVGALTLPLLLVLKVPNAVLLAIIAAVFELIPIFGPILAAIPAVAFALIAGGPSLGLLVAGMYIIIQQFENHLFQPLVVKKIVGIPALVAILALIIGAQIAGFLGMLISVPVAAAIMEYFSDVEKSKAKVNNA
jgi:predicted PurR-regulated permease PerM